MTLRCEDGHEAVEWSDRDAPCFVCGGEGLRVWGYMSMCSARGPIYREDVA